MSLVIVGDEIDSRRERLSGCVEILLVLLERPDHLVDRVRAEQRLLRERRLKLAHGVGTLALALIGQAEQVVRLSGRGQRAKRVDQCLLRLVELLVLDERVGERETRSLVARVEPDCLRNSADAARASPSARSTIPRIRCASARSADCASAALSCFRASSTRPLLNAAAARAIGSAVGSASASSADRGATTREVV